MDIGSTQKVILYDLMMLRIDDGIQSKGLDRLIRRMKATMDERDVRFVDSLIEETCRCSGILDKM